MKTDKLKKLLNQWLEYQEKVGPGKLTRVSHIDTSGDPIIFLENGGDYHQHYIVSKECGFIGWLCKNNKINSPRVVDNIAYIPIYRGTIKQEDAIDDLHQEIDTVLMALSIQMRPLEFLVDMLR